MSELTLQQQLTQLRDTIAQQAQARAVLEAAGIDVDSLLDRLHTQAAELEQQIKIGSGSAAIGDNTQATGERGVIAETVYGNVQTGDTNIYLGRQPHDWQTLQRAYLSHMLTTCGRLALTGIDPQAASEAQSHIELGRIYTSLFTTESDWAMGDSVRMERGDPTQGRHLTPLELLDQHTHLVLLGDPGSGKSTFVNFLALCMAGELLNDEQFNLQLLTAPPPQEDGSDHEMEQRWQHGALLPIRVILRDFAVRGLPPVGEQGTAQHLWRFIVAELDKRLPEFAEPLRQHLQQTGCLLLLDGLDEVPSANERRVQLKQVVEDFAATFPNCRILVTSRTYAYQQQAWQLRGFADTLLAPFSIGQIRRFVDRWYAHIGNLRSLNAQESTGRATLLKQAIEQGRRLRGLAERPLLLTLMASLHAWRGGTLPEKREELYRDAVELLLDWWESQRHVHDDAGNIVMLQPSLAEWLKIDRDKVRALLNRLAYEAHSGQDSLVGTADIAEGELIGGLIAISNNPDVRPQRLIEYLRDRAGLLVQRGVGVYTFPHRTFQEYLAACHLTDDDFPDKIAELTRHDPNRWREVALLAGAKAARGMSAAVWLLADALCSAPVPADSVAGSLADCWGAHIASELLVESGIGDIVTIERLRSKHSKLRNWLIHIMCGEQLPANERALASRSVSILGDPRAHVLTVEQMQFCYVPAGSFWMGSEEGNKNEKPLHQVDLPYGYWISRFPITNAQFTQFVAAGGYRRAEWWREAAADGFWRDGLFEGRFDREPRDRPATVQPPFNQANHPVVDITWYEMLAFTRWLREAWRLPAGVTVQLPSEAEWEKAARGGAELPVEPQHMTVTQLTQYAGQMQPNPDPQRVFPWGATYTAERANGSASDIGTTSGVGCFPTGSSPYGVEELSGNIFEWTRDLYRDYPYQLQRHDGQTVMRSSRPVLRNGSYGESESVHRCAFRDWYHPDLGNDNIGFRIVVSPFVSGL